MARRSTSYLLDLGSDQETELSLSEWNELLSGGWIERTGYKTARPRRGVVAWIRGGDLWLTPLARIPAVTARWFVIWLFQIEIMSAAYLTESRSQRHYRVLLERERERQNEALIWLASRKTKGANEFRWMTPAQKAEVMRLKPELMGESA
jgi:hypothetical protein